MYSQIFNNFFQKLCYSLACKGKKINKSIIRSLYFSLLNINFKKKIFIVIFFMVCKKSSLN